MKNQHDINKKIMELSSSEPEMKLNRDHWIQTREGDVQKSSLPESVGLVPRKDSVTTVPG